MKTVLKIDSSGRTERSVTRRLTNRFVAQWRALRPADRIVTRDLGLEPPPPVNQAWIAAAFTPPEKRSPEMQAALRVSDTLVDELVEADVIVLGAPMYNFGMPAQLKAYIDQVVRVGRTFAFDPSDKQQPYRPLLPPKQMVVLTASGDAGYEPGGPLAHMNHLEPHLRTVFGFLGVSDPTVIRVGYDEFADERVRRSIERAEHDIDALVLAWATPAAEPVAVAC